MELPSTKPYLIRAIWQWCCDNGFTPYIAVTIDEWTRVPREAVRDGQIVLNVGMDATNKLDIGNDVIQFQARFNGIARDISVPIYTVAAIYARENGAGMAFEVGTAESPGKGTGPIGGNGEQEAPLPEVDEAPSAPSAPAGKKSSHLQRIK